MARDQFAIDDATHERIRAIDDKVVWKVKIQRWRGAVWTDEHIPRLMLSPRRELWPWLCQGDSGVWKRQRVPEALVRRRSRVASFASSVSATATYHAS
jgi:hypothetical protein